MPVIPVNKVVEQKRIIEKVGAQEEGHSGSLTQKRHLSNEKVSTEL
jgi:hypothetical protein